MGITHTLLTELF